MNKLRILFVDDEQHLLDGLQALLRRHRRNWDMTFALGGKKALEILKSASFDLVITDLRMPNIDGITLLTEIKEKYPQTVRIILSGTMEIDSTLQAVSVTHQFLSKPCNADTLERVIERINTLIDFNENKLDRICQMIGRMNKLPSVPTVYAQLLKSTHDETVTAKDIATLLEQDMAICAKILQLVNSSFFRCARSIIRMQEAVNYLGVNLIKQITLASEVFSSAENHPKIDGFSINALQQHALLTAAIASQIVTDKHQVNDAFLAGMLHDIGLLVFAAGSPDQFGKILVIARKEKRPLYVVEQELCGITHADVGGYLLGMWGLPYPLAEVAAYHHTPSLISHDSLTILPAVYVAQVLAHEVAADDFESREELDLDYLAELGVVDQLESWREIARQEFQKSNHE